MMRTSPPQVAFSAGEIDPLLHGRFDYQRYQTGLARCHGFLPLPQGGIARAPGTTWLGSPKNNLPTKLVPFQFSATDAVVLEFTPGWMRVWRYGSLVQKPDLSGPYELATPFNSGDLDDLRWVQSADVIYMVDGRNPVQRLSRYALNNWTIAPQVFDTGPFRVQNLDKTKEITASDVSGTITLTTNFDFFTADHAGSLLQLTPTDNSTIPLWTSNENLLKIRNVINGSWTGDATWTDEDAPTDRVVRRYGKNVYELTQGKNSGENPPIHTDGEELVDNKPTKWLYLNDDIGIVRITAITDAREATATVLRQLSIAVVASPTYRWSEGSWSEVYGYPAAIELYEQRLCFAASPSEPRTVWFSTVGAYTDFLPSTEPDGAFAYAIAGSSSLNAITGLRTGRAGLHIFAMAEEYSSRAETRASTIGPTNVYFGLDGSSGAKPGRMIAPQGDPIFVTRDGRRVVMVRYDLQADANREVILSRASQHLGEAGFGRMAWQQTPEPRAWILRDTGDLAVMIFDDAEDILGWSTHSVAGTVQDVIVTQNAGGTDDQVWLVVERGEELSIEYLDWRHHLFQAKFIDLYPSGGIPPAPFGTVSVPWLEGKTVTTYAFGALAVEAETVVPAGGVVDLGTQTLNAVVGLTDDSHEALTLDITAAAPDGNSTGRAKRLTGPLGLILHQTIGGTVQVVESTDPGDSRPSPSPQPVIQRAIGVGLSSPFTGVVQIRLPGGHARRQQLRFRPVGNRPLTVLGIVPTIQEAGL